MYETNHEIDRPKKHWSKSDVERLFVFCQIDKGIPYSRVCEIFDIMDICGYTNFEFIRKTNKKYIKQTLKRQGHRFYNQITDHLYENANKLTTEQLLVWSRDLIKTNCKGFGFKLSSMFYNRIHNTFNYAIIDVHVKRYCENNGYKGNLNNYKDMELFLKDLAKDKEMTLEELDWDIWNSNRIDNRG